ncbi:MAG: phytanoyl-CoA dioxygenase family protein [Polaromonas sp.]
MQIVKRPQLAYYFGQKAIRHPGLRGWCARKMTGWVAARTQTSSNAISASAADAAALQALRTDGIAFLPQLHMDASTLARVHAYFRGKPVLDLYSGQQLPGMEDLPAHYNKVAYSTADTLGCQPLLELANHPALLATVAQYLGAKPTMASMQTWWTIGEHSVQGQKHYDDVYHRDVDDLRFVKLFIYLTDTTVSSGAHSFIKASHRSNALIRRGPITDPEAQESFAADDFVTVTGRAGTVFLEDTWGIHRPLLATEGRRLIFSVLYGLTPWVPQGPANALFPLPEGFDPYINRAHFHLP